MLLRCVSGLAALVFVVCGPVSAQTQPVETQLRINAILQDALIWTGHYEGLSDGALGQRSITAMADYQRAIGQPATGDLATEQKLHLLKAANEQRQRMVPQAGFSVALPTAVVAWKNNRPNGSRYSSSDGKIEIVVSKFLTTEQPFRGLYEGLLSLPAMRPVTMRVYRSDAFFVAGENENEDYYFTARLEAGVIKGLAITTPRARRPEMSRLIVAIANAFHNSMPDYAVAAALVAERRPPAVAGYTKRVEPETQAAPPPTPQQAHAAPPKEMVSTGTGFFVSDAGHILTNAHVVKGCTSTMVAQPGGKSEFARIVAVDATNDLALLSAPWRQSNVPHLKSGVRTGEAIAVFGFPHIGVLPSTGNFTLGNVTATAGLGDDSRMLQISAPVQSGNSGGPLMDQSGNIAGVIVSKLNVLSMLKSSGDLPQNVNFAIKASVARTFLESNGIVPHARASVPPLSAPDLADAAKLFTVFIACKG
jgi:serine protease Do